MIWSACLNNRLCSWRLRVYWNVYILTTYLKSNTDTRTKHRGVFQLQYWSHHPTSPVGWSARSQSLFRTNQCIMNYTLVVDYKFSAHFQIWCMIGVHKKSPSTGVVLIGYCIPHQWLVSPMIVWNRVAWFVVILPRADLNTVLFNTLSYTYARTHIYYRCEIHTLWFCYLYSRLEYIFSNLLCQLQSSYATKFASQSFSLDWCLMFIH